MHTRHAMIVAAILFSISGRAAAQDLPKIEVSGGYSYVRANQINSGGCCFHMNGGSGSLAVNVNRHIRLVGEIGGYHSGNVNSTGLDLNVVSYLFGPRIALRNHTRVTPFGEILAGGAHASGTLYSGAPASSGLGSQNGFAAAVGGGLDVKVSRRVALRLIQADYFVTKLQNGSNNHQNNLRISAGLVLHFGNH